MTIAYRAKVIEYVNWDYNMKLMKNPAEFEAKLSQAQAREAATMQPTHKKLEHVIAVLKQTEKEAKVIGCTV